MVPLVRIRSERDQMSAIERRIADFLLENAHLLRDYSSQQLADALGISQSSVVKFSQKLGFKGYPDLKFSIGAAVARNGAVEAVQPAKAAPDAPMAEALWQAKAKSEEETRLINPSDQLDAVVALLAHATRIFVGGVGADGLRAQLFAHQLGVLGLCAICHTDVLMLDASLACASEGDVLLLFCEHGRQVDLCHVARDFRARHGKVVSISRHTANPLRAHADLALLVSAHDDRPHVEPLLYQAATQHLLDRVFVQMCEASAERGAQLKAALERARQLVQS
jgi:DNA-binding MurR/RpiR family transcriptional regulator